MKNSIIFTMLVTVLYIVSFLGIILFGVAALFSEDFEYLVLCIICFIILLLIVIWVSKQPKKEETK